MGTTMAFYSIMNTGFALGELEKSMEEISDWSKKRAGELDAILAQFMPPEMIAQRRKEFAETQAHFGAVFGQNPKENRPVIAFRDAAGWLPLFEVHLCEGNTASDEELKRLYEIFGAPVLAFSIFDSDVLFVSYIDDRQQIHHHAKPNIDEFEEYDTECYSKECPEFLVGFCGEDGQEKLWDIWEKKDYVFADDRMHDICALMGIATLYDSSEIPEGYQPVFAAM